LCQIRTTKTDTVEPAGRTGGSRHARTWHLSCCVQEGGPKRRSDWATAR